MRERRPKRKRLRSIINNIQYLFTANMARRRFGMLDSLFPKSPDEKTLKESVTDAFYREEKILDLGCGDKAQALLDLYNAGFSNLYGIDLNPPKRVPKGVQVKKGLIEDTGYDNNEFKGTVYSAYVVAYLSPEDQLKTLRELDRITGDGARGYIGPFQPKALVNSRFHKEYPDYKNPLYGFIKEMNQKGNGTWNLYRNFQYSTTRELKNRKVGEYYYRIPVPLFTYYVMMGRSILRKFMPNIKIKKDGYSNISFEYFITFTK